VPKFVTVLALLRSTPVVPPEIDAVVAPIPPVVTTPPA
jgi:hypothetical protein